MEEGNKGESVATSKRNGVEVGGGGRQAHHHVLHWPHRVLDMHILNLLLNDGRTINVHLTHYCHSISEINELPISNLTCSN